MILADKIIEQRKKNGWSQEELAERMNVSRQAVSKWEGAQSMPDLEKILALSRLFGVSTDYLLRDEVEESGVGSAVEEAPARRRVSMEQANAFLQVKEMTAPRIALGVFLCILSPIALMLLGAASEMTSAVTEEMAVGLGMSILLVLVAVAVVLFMTSGEKTSAYEFLEKEEFETEYGVAGLVRERQAQYRSTYTRANVLGVCSCILSLVPLFMGIFLTGNELLAVAMLCVMLFMCALGCVCFILAGIRWASYQKLLEEGDYARENKKKRGLSGALSTGYWLVVVAIYLAVSLSMETWEETWVVWPVAAMVYAALTILLKGVSQR